MYTMIGDPAPEYFLLPKLASSVTDSPFPWTVPFARSDPLLFSPP